MITFGINGWYSVFHFCGYVFSGFLASIYGFSLHSYTDHIKKYTAHVFDSMGGSVYTSLSPRSVVRFECLCISEPKINASDQIILPLDGSIKPVWLKCNLTTAQTPHKDSFWMKNGQEITNTRTEQRNTAYRWQRLPLSLLGHILGTHKKECLQQSKENN